MTTLPELIQGDRGCDGRPKRSDALAARATNIRSAKIRREHDFLAVRGDFGQIGIICSASAVAHRRAGLKSAGCNGKVGIGCTSGNVDVTGGIDSDAAGYRAASIAGPSLRAAEPG